jgi:3-hydroxybutyryl-CoA dehydratase
MCTFSFMTSVVTSWCYASGGFISRLESKFIKPVRPGDTITCKGVVSEKHPRRTTKNFVVIDLSAENQEGEKVAVAKARVTIP